MATVKDSPNRRKKEDVYISGDLPDELSIARNDYDHKHLGATKVFSISSMSYDSRVGQLWSRQSACFLFSPRQKKSESYRET